MNMLTGLILCTLAASSLALYPPKAPPTEYGPPPARITPPSPVYGVPAVRVTAPPPVYGPPTTPPIVYGPPPVSRHTVPVPPLPVYGVPQVVRKPTIEYGVPKIEIPYKPQTVYGAPKIEIPHKPQIVYGAPKIEIPHKPEIVYGAPHVEIRKPAIVYGAPQVEIRKPAIVYGVPQRIEKPSIVYGTPNVEIRQPAREYGVPKIETPRQEYGVPVAPVPVYGVPQVNPIPHKTITIPQLQSLPHEHSTTVFQINHNSTSHKSNEVHSNSEDAIVPHKTYEIPTEITLPSIYTTNFESQNNRNHIAPRETYDFPEKIEIPLKTLEDSINLNEISFPNINFNIFGSQTHPIVPQKTYGVPKIESHINDHSSTVHTQNSLGSFHSLFKHLTPLTFGDLHVIPINTFRFSKIAVLKKLLIPGYIQGRIIQPHGEYGVPNH